MSIKIETGTFSLASGESLTADGGIAHSYVNTPGNGGNGGGRGGDGGAGGHTGSGGGGGTIQITTEQGAEINGLISANGGERDVMSVTSGNGGDAGPEVGSDGGDGGIIQDAGSAGGAGKISLQSKFSDVTGTGSVVANGGNVSFQPDLTGGPLMQGGNGGSAGGVHRTGGAAALPATGPGTGAGGKITVDGDTSITLGSYPGQRHRLLGLS